MSVRMDQMLLLFVVTVNLHVPALTWDINLHCPADPWISGTETTLTCSLLTASYPSKCTTYHIDELDFRLTPSTGAIFSVCKVNNFTSCTPFPTGQLGCQCVSDNSTMKTFEYKFTADTTRFGSWDCGVPCLVGANPVLDLTTENCDNRGGIPAPTTSPPACSDNSCRTSNKTVSTTTTTTTTQSPTPPDDVMIGTCTVDNGRFRGKNISGSDISGSDISGSDTSDWIFYYRCCEDWVRVLISYGFLCGSSLLCVCIIIWVDLKGWRRRTFDPDNGIWWCLLLILLIVVFIIIPLILVVCMICAAIWKKWPCDRDKQREEKVKGWHLLLALVCNIIPGFTVVYIVVAAILEKWPFEKDKGKYKPSGERWQILIFVIVLQLCFVWFTYMTVAGVCGHFPIEKCTCTCELCIGFPSDLETCKDVVDPIDGEIAAFVIGLLYIANFVCYLIVAIVIGLWPFNPIMNPLVKCGTCHIWRRFAVTLYDDTLQDIFTEPSLNEIFKSCANHDDKEFSPEQVKQKIEEILKKCEMGVIGSVQLDQTICLKDHESNQWYKQDRPPNKNEMDAAKEGKWIWRKQDNGTKVDRGQMVAILQIRLYLLTNTSGENPTSTAAARGHGGAMEMRSAHIVSSSPDKQKKASKKVESEHTHSDNRSKKSKPEMEPEVPLDKVSESSADHVRHLPEPKSKLTPVERSSRELPTPTVNGSSTPREPLPPIGRK